MAETEQAMEEARQYLEDVKKNAVPRGAVSLNLHLSSLLWLLPSILPLSLSFPFPLETLPLSPFLLISTSPSLLPYSPTLLLLIPFPFPLSLSPLPSPLSPLPFITSSLHASSSSSPLFWLTVLRSGGWRES